MLLQLYYEVVLLNANYFNKIRHQNIDGLTSQIGYSFAPSGQSSKHYAGTPLKSENKTILSIDYVVTARKFEFSTHPSVLSEVAAVTVLLGATTFGVGTTLRVMTLAVDSGADERIWNKIMSSGPVKKLGFLPVFAAVTLVPVAVSLAYLNWDALTGDTRSANSKNR